MGKSFPKITPDYSKYLNDQSVYYRSSERELTRYHAGMRKAFDWFFSENTPYGKHVLDVGCGDGIQLGWLIEAGALSATGIELSPEKAAVAKEYTPLADVLNCDFHDDSQLSKTGYDIIFSSHSLEHAYDPGAVVQVWLRHLTPGGRICIVLPYPDAGPDTAHGGKYALGTHLNDNGAAVLGFFRSLGLIPLRYAFDTTRETEIWLELVVKQ